MSTEGERISDIISHFCKSKADFARNMGESPQTISNWVSRGAGKNVLNKILSKFPDVNATWLITGEGEMIRSDYKQGSVHQTEVESNTISEEQPSSDYEQSDKSSDLRLKIISAYEEMLKSKDAEIDRMQKELASKNDEIRIELAMRNDEINKLKSLIKDAGLNLPHDD